MTPPASGSIFSDTHRGRQASPSELNDKNQCRHHAQTPKQARPNPFLTIENQNQPQRQAARRGGIRGQHQQREEEERQPRADRPKEIRGRGIRRHSQEANITPVVRKQAERQEHA